MGTNLRRLVAVLVLGAVIVLLAMTLGRASNQSASEAKAAAAGATVHATMREREQGEGDGGAAAEAYADRAYPGDEVTMAEIQGALKANANVAKKASKLTSKWDFIGPETLDVDRLGTQSFVKPTQWSGRITALTIDPSCTSLECTLYVGAAGGGVWRTTNATAPNAAWKQISDGIPTNAIGSIAIDPNDPTHKTIYVGTGEANASGDSEAGLGLYKTTDGGAHWSLVQGSFPITNNRSIAWIAPEPGNANHILLGTRAGQRGMGSNASNGATPAAVSPAVGVYNSTDGGANWTLTRAGSVNEVKFDPTNSSTVYASVATAGLLRSTAGGATGTWEAIFSLNRGRYSFSPVA